MSGGLMPSALMSKAVRASLFESWASVQPDIGKAHRGLISAFGQHLVNNGQISKEMGRLMKRAEENCLVAEYKGGSVELVDAREMVDQAERFVEAMRAEFVPHLIDLTLSK